MTRRRTVVSILPAALLCMAPSLVRAGPNADGALIVHVDSSVSYTQGYDYCQTGERLLTGCTDARTRVDAVAGGSPAVLWLFAAFPAGSNPSVVVVDFGIAHTLPPGGVVAYGVCGSGAVDLPDDTFPDSDSGATVGFEAVRDDLFPFYWFALDGDAGATFATVANPNSGQAAFVDDSDPPEMDSCRRFGEARWGSEGSNDCPQAIQFRSASWGEVKATYR